MASAFADRFGSDRVFANRQSESLVMAQPVSSATGRYDPSATFDLRTADSRLAPNGSHSNGPVHSPKKADIANAQARASCARNVEPATRQQGRWLQLADMPQFTTEHLKVLVSVFGEGGGRIIVRASARGMPDNFVILPRAMSPALAELTGGY